MRVPGNALVTSAWCQNLAQTTVPQLEDITDESGDEASYDV